MGPVPAGESPAFGRLFAVVFEVLLPVRYPRELDGPPPLLPERNVARGNHSVYRLLHVATLVGREPPCNGLGLVMPVPYYPFLHHSTDDAEREVEVFVGQRHGRTLVALWCINVGLAGPARSGEQMTGLLFLMIYRTGSGILDLD